MSSSSTQSRSVRTFSYNRSASRNISSHTTSKTTIHYGRAPSLTPSQRSSSLPVGKHPSVPIQFPLNGKHNREDSSSRMRACTPLRPLNYLGALSSTTRKGAWSPSRAKKASSSSVSRPTSFFNHFSAVPQRGFYAPCRCVVSVVTTSDPSYSVHEVPERDSLSPPNSPQPLVVSCSGRLAQPSCSSSIPSSPVGEERSEGVTPAFPSHGSEDDEKNKRHALEAVKYDAKKAAKLPPLLLSSSIHHTRHASSGSGLLLSPFGDTTVQKPSQRGVLRTKMASPFVASPFNPQGLSGVDTSSYTVHTTLKSAAAATKALAAYRGRKYQQDVVNAHLDLYECTKSGLHSTLWAASVDGSIEVRSISSPSLLLRVIDPPTSAKNTGDSSRASAFCVSCMKQIGQNHVAVGDTLGYLHIYHSGTGQLVDTVKAHTHSVMCMSTVRMPTTRSSSTSGSRSSSNSSSRSDTSGGGNEEEGEERKGRVHPAQRAGKARESKPTRPPLQALSALDEELCFPRATVLLTGSRDGTVGKWDGVTLECLGRLCYVGSKRGIQPITALVGTFNGCYAFSGSENGAIRFWNLMDNTEIKISRSERVALLKYRRNREELQDKVLAPSSRSQSMRSNRSAGTMGSSYSSRASTSPVTPRHQIQKTASECGVSSTSCILPPPLYSSKKEQKISVQTTGSRAGHGFDYYYPPPAFDLRSTGPQATLHKRSTSSPMPSTKKKGGKEEEKTSTLSASLLSLLRRESSTPQGKTTNDTSPKPNSSMTGKGTEKRGNSCPPFLSRPVRGEKTAFSGFPLPSQGQDLDYASRRAPPLSHSGDFARSRSGRGRGDARGRNSRRDSSAYDSFVTPHRQRENSVTTPLTNHNPRTGSGLSSFPLSASLLESKKKNGTSSSKQNTRKGVSEEECESLLERIRKSLHAYQAEYASPLSRSQSSSPAPYLKSSSNAVNGERRSASRPSLRAASSDISKALQLNDEEELNPFSFEFPLLHAHEDRINCLEVVEDRVLVSCSRDGTANVFQLPSGHHLHRLAPFYTRSRSPALSHLYYHSFTSRLYVFNEEGEVAAFSMLSNLFEMVLKPTRCEMPTPASTYTVVKADALQRFVFFTISDEKDIHEKNGASLPLFSSSVATTPGSVKKTTATRKVADARFPPLASSSSCWCSAISIVAQIDRNVYPSSDKSVKKPMRKGREISREQTKSVDVPSSVHLSSSEVTQETLVLPAYPTVHGGGAVGASSPPVGSMLLSSPVVESAVGACSKAEIETAEQLRQLQENYTHQRRRIDAVERAGSVENLERKELKKRVNILWRWRMRGVGQECFLRWLRWTMRRTQGREMRRNAIKEMESAVFHVVRHRYFSRWSQWYHEQALECFQSRLEYFTNRQRGEGNAVKCAPMDFNVYPIPHLERRPLLRCEGATIVKPSFMTFRRAPFSAAAGPIVRQLQKVIGVMEQKRNWVRRLYTYEMWRHFVKRRRNREAQEIGYNRLLLASCPSTQTITAVVFFSLRNKALQPAIRKGALQLLQTRYLHYARFCLIKYFRKWVHFRKEAVQLRLLGCDWGVPHAAVVFSSFCEMLSRYFHQWATFASYQAREDRLRRECLMVKREWIIIQQVVKDSPSVEELHLEVLTEETDLMRLSDERETQALRWKEAEQSLLQLYLRDAFHRFLHGFSSIDAQGLCYSLARRRELQEEAVEEGSLLAAGSPSVPFRSDETPVVLSSLPVRVRNASSPPSSPTVFRMLGGGEHLNPQKNMREEGRIKSEEEEKEEEEEEYRCKLCSMFRALKGCVLHFGRDYVKLCAASKAVELLCRADDDFLDLFPTTCEQHEESEAQQRRMGSLSNVHFKETLRDENIHRRTFSSSQSRYTPSSSIVSSSLPPQLGERRRKAPEGSPLASPAPPAHSIWDRSFTSISEAFESRCADLLYALHEAARECGIDPNNKSQFLGSIVFLPKASQPAPSTPCRNGRPSALPFTDGTKEAYSCSFQEEKEHPRITGNEEGRGDALGMGMLGGRSGSGGYGSPTTACTASTVTNTNSSSSHSWAKHDDYHSASRVVASDVDLFRRYPSCEGEEECSSHRSHLLLPSGHDVQRSVPHAVMGSHDPETREMQKYSSVQKKVKDEELEEQADRSLHPSSTSFTFPASLSVAAPPLSYSYLSSHTSPFTFSLHTTTPWPQLVSLRARQRVAELLLYLLVLFDCISLKSEDIFFISRGERIVPLTSFCSLSTVAQLMEHAAIIFELLFPQLWRRIEVLEKYFHSLSTSSSTSSFLTAMTGRCEGNLKTKHGQEWFASSILGCPSLLLKPSSGLLSGASTPSPQRRADTSTGSISAGLMNPTATSTECDDLALWSTTAVPRSPLGSFPRGFPFSSSPNGVPSTPKKAPSRSMTPGRGARSAPTTPTRSFQRPVGGRESDLGRGLPISHLYGSYTERKDAMTPPIATVTPHLSHERVPLQPSRAAPSFHSREFPSPEGEPYEKGAIHRPLRLDGVKEKEFHSPMLVDTSSSYMGIEEEPQGGLMSPSHFSISRREERVSGPSSTYQHNRNGEKSVTPLSGRSMNSISLSGGRSVSAGTLSVSHFRTSSGVFRPLTSYDMDDDRRSLLSFSSTTPRGSVRSSTGGVFQKPFLGFRVQVLRDAASNTSSIAIKDVVETYTTISGEEAPGPAAVAGIQAGDRIVRFAHYAVTDLAAFNAIIARHVKPGAVLPVAVLRKNEIISTELKVAVRLS